MIATVRPEVSVVIPVYNEEENLDRLFERLFPVLDGLDTAFEVVAVDDGSADRSLEILEAWRERRPELDVVPLARNFGQHAAVLAGLVRSRGERVITMDADLQNPPEEIPAVVDAMRQGHDLVNTRRLGRCDSLFRRLASAVNCWVTRKLSGSRLRDFGSMLRGYDRSVVDALTAGHGYRAFIPALGMLHARRPTEIAVKHEPRAGGDSKYSLLKLLGLQLDLTTTFSVAPLRALFMIGVAIAGVAVGFGVLLIALRIWFGATWAGEGVFTLFAILFFFIGMQFIAFGILGEYIGRIYQEVRRRPAYLLRDDASHDTESGAARPAARRAASPPPHEVDTLAPDRSGDAPAVGADR